MTVFEPERDDRRGVDSDDLVRHPWPEGRLAGKGFGVAAHLDAADLPGLVRGDVIDHERHVGVGGQVTELAAAAHGQAADVDGAELSVPPERDRAVLRHNALSDPRPLRLLIWRGLTDPGQAPPDASPPAEDLTSTRDRQRRGELPGDIEPATLRLLLLSAVAAPVAFPDTARRLFGVSPDDHGFEERYLDGLRRLLARLVSPPAH